MNITPSSGFFPASRHMVTQKSNSLLSYSSRGSPPHSSRLTTLSARTIKSKPLHPLSHNFFPHTPGQRKVTAQDEQYVMFTVCCPEPKSCLTCPLGTPESKGHTELPTSPSRYLDLTSPATHSLEGAGTGAGQHDTALLYFCKMKQHMPRDPINQVQTKTKSRLQPSFPILKSASKPSKWSLRRKLQSSQPFFFFLTAVTISFLLHLHLLKTYPNTWLQHFP